MVEVVSEQLEYTDATGKGYEGTVCYQKSWKGSSTKRPGVLVLHAFGGCSEWEQSRAADLAKAGYVALAADVYGKGTRGTTKEENFALLRPLVAGDRAELGGRLAASRDALANLPYTDATKIGAIGYCFGGLCSLDLARRHIPGVKAVVSFHGTLKPFDGMAIEPIEASVQVHNGDADPHIGKDTIQAFYQEMRDRKADWHYMEHGNAEHAFTEPHAAALGVPGVNYEPKAARRSWDQSLAFLNEILLGH